MMCSRSPSPAFKFASHHACAAVTDTI
jgi:hypothetical protein